MSNWYFSRVIKYSYMPSLTKRRRPRRRPISFRSQRLGEVHQCGGLCMSGGTKFKLCFCTRQSKRRNLSALRCNTTQYRLRSIHYSGFRLWNSLPTDIRNSVSLSNFRSKIKSYYIYIYMSMVHRIFMICAILLTHFSSVLY